LDADGLTFACALAAERRAARKLGPTALVGMACAHGVPEGRLVSFGLAGALRDDLPVGMVIDAVRVVDEEGAVLWQGGPLGIAGARQGTILGASRIVDDPAERVRLAEATGADAVDMESGVYARAGLLAGCIRAVSDTPERQLGPLVQALRPDGSIDLVGALRAFAGSPRESTRAARDVRAALRSLGSLTLVTPGELGSVA
jgi:threonine dehydrogenase-like Zn-dependent dehydrogenase